MINLTINGKAATAAEGTTVLDAARGAGVEIPTLCHDPRLKPYGGCRLCLVEIEGVPRPVTACTTPAAEGMAVTTESDKLYGLRKTVIELLLSDHPNDCMVCERAGDCSLQEFAYFYGLRDNRFWGARRQYQNKDNNAFIERDMEKCILCAKCVRVCDEVQGVGAIDLAYRGFQAKVCPPYEKDLECEFCGQCVSVCPTGALTGKSWAGRGRQKGTRTMDTICPYCGCGCNMTLHMRGNEVIRVSSDPDTLNEGWLCPKGRFGYGFISRDDRLKTPLIRKSKDGELEPASWDEALDMIASKLGSILQEHGPDAIGGLASARCTNEENFAFQKFMRTVIGTNNVDHCARY